MSIQECWARTDEQIERMYYARTQGGYCAWCSRQLAADEPVYMERFLHGERRLRRAGPVTHRSNAWAPVGAECASPELLDQSRSQHPEPCAGCGRGVFYRQSRWVRRQAICSRRCAAFLTRSPHSPGDDLAEVSTDLSMLHAVKAIVRIDIAAGDPRTVGSILHRYRARLGLTERELADRLGISLTQLANLAEKQRPSAGDRDAALARFVRHYGVDRERLIEAFDQSHSWPRPGAESSAPSAVPDETQRVDNRRWDGR